MTVTLTFKPDVEAGLLAQAQAAGMTVEQYLLFMVEGAVLPAAPNTSSPEQPCKSTTARLPPSPRCSILC
jgi:hypothetical protein